MTKPRFLCDVDGVLADFVSPTLKIASEIMEQNYQTHMVTKWEIFRSLGINKKDEEIIRKRLKDPYFCLNLPVYPGAVEAVKRLKKETDFFICTSPLDSTYWAREREMWLEEHFGIDRSRVISCSRKEVVEADFLLDDKGKNLEDWYIENPDRRIPIMWHCPWNRDERDPTFEQAQGWDDVFMIIRKYEVKNDSR
jgi:5'(3')-deoxyribonucleotidase